ncbi:GxxExxY protein [Sphaerospermopsis aphanizomenoides BCCUSP55]|uniref:GxxExxY protein n=1 Tax=Sphaerospermopsis aphanizomenoides TaxID=459663 RepID=UPI000AE707A5|nr:GxxExxY protein [Sphaerospermopsis aphanizomenoides]MBK1990076.1 GxxExxY protein [Sphaerospermopsis aphanizomenoides BCCUSP55]
MRQPNEQVEQLAYRVIGAAIEVHQVLGSGFLEEVYHRALREEFLFRQIPHTFEHPVKLHYKGRLVGEGKLDFLVGDSLIVELKAVQSLTPIHEAQVLSYLKMTKYPLALLINFNVSLLREGIKRIILSS